MDTPRTFLYECRHLIQTPRGGHARNLLLFYFLFASCRFRECSPRTIAPFACFAPSLAVCLPRLANQAVLFAVLWAGFVC